MKYLFLIAALFLSHYAFNQTKSPNISFEKTEHDFGKFPEEKGSVTYEFKFTNTGSSPLIITDVKTSCLCITSIWSKDPVLPGKIGLVKTTYNPKNRPGPFNKSITVTSNVVNSGVVLIIKGYVINTSTDENDFPTQMGDIRIKSNHLAFNKLKNNETKTDSLTIINTSMAPISITFDKVPTYITIKSEPAILKSGQKGYIKATYDANKVSNSGFIIDRISVIFNDNSSNHNLLSISATIEEDFSKSKNSLMIFRPMNTQPNLLVEKKSNCKIDYKKYCKLLYIDSATWSGSIVSGVLEGNGELIFYRKNNKTWTFNGNIISGVLNGNGKLRYENGVYEGNFKDNDFNGNGTMVYNKIFNNYDDKTKIYFKKYSGNWVNGNFEGEGKLEYTEWSNRGYTGSQWNDYTYEGSFSNGLRNGIGYLDGRKVEYINGVYVEENTSSKSSSSYSSSSSGCVIKIRQTDESAVCDDCYPKKIKVKCETKLGEQEMFYWSGSGNCGCWIKPNKIGYWKCGMEYNPNTKNYLGTDEKLAAKKLCECE